MILFRLKTPLANLSPLEDYPLKFHAWETELLHDPNRDTLIIVMAAVNTREVRFCNLLETISKAIKNIFSVRVMPGHYSSPLRFGHLCSLVQDHSIKERKLLIPIVRLPPGHLLCPLQAYEPHVHLFPAPPSSVAFLSPITHVVVTPKLRLSLCSVGQS